MNKKQKTVFVGMSGGVDSSVSAALLKKDGYRVVGVHLRCWNSNGCADSDSEDARRVAEILDIPFYVFDFEKEYKERVVDYMVEGYRRGITPNPDVMCNHEIKFGLFFERAMEMGADYVATGHYARIARIMSGGIKNRGRDNIKNKGEYQLLAGLDKNKDQSYFLWNIAKEQLAKTLFPIGDLKKTEVRKLAKKFNLQNAGKKDSQGVCFVGEISLPEFLEEFIPKKRGRILNEGGDYLGDHSGVHNFTIGQRHGLGVGGFAQPHYVVEKDINSNILVLAPKNTKKAIKKSFILEDFNFFTKLKSKTDVLARFRYRQPLERAKLSLKKSRKGSGKKNWELAFKKEQFFVAEGQSAVIYDLKGERVLGGGIIKQAN